MVDVLEDCGMEHDDGRRASVFRWTEHAPKEVRMMALFAWLLTRVDIANHAARPPDIAVRAAGEAPRSCCAACPIDIGFCGDAPGAL